MAEKFANSFSVGVFACGRELFNPNQHYEFFSGTKQEALTHFTKIATDEMVESQIASASKKKQDSARKMK